MGETPLRRTTLSIAFFLLSALCGGHALAQDNEIIEPAFSADRWAVTLETFGAVDVTNRDVGMLGPTIGLMYGVRHDLDIGLEIGGMHVWQDHDTNALVGNLLARIYLAEWRKGRVFFDIGGGLFRASERVPEEGTHFNTTLQMGFGLLYPINEDVSFVGGIRYYHLSNARRRGNDRNPSLNGPAFYVGVQFSL